MRLLNRRPLVTVLVLSIITLLLAAACAGPEGTSGTKGDAGSSGAKGDAGSSGDQGFRGYPGARGESGSTGAVGAQGDTGPAGPTVPVNIIVVATAATGNSSGSVPAIIAVGTSQPKFTLYASGLPAGEMVSVELHIDPTHSYIMRRLKSGSDSFVRDSGAYVANYQANKALLTDIPAGLYTVEITTGPSGIMATAPLLLVESK